MTSAWVSVVLDGLVAVLLAAVIYYAVRLNRGLEGLRQGKAELGSLIARFDAAAAHAEQSVARLGEAGAESGRALRAAIAEAQSLRDELAFMLERGGKIAENISVLPLPKASKTTDPSAARAPRRRPRPVEEPLAADVPGASAMERDLLRALKTARLEG